MIFIRAARAGDQAVIRRMVRRAGLNVLGVNWPRFVVAEDARTGALVGAGQVRLYGDGAQELASIVVAPEVRGQGVGRALVATLLSRTEGELYLFCRAQMESYYARFGFGKVAAAVMPGSLAWRLRVGQTVAGMFARLSGQRIGVIGMQRLSEASRETSREARGFGAGDSRGG